VKRGVKWRDVPCFGFQNSTVWSLVEHTSRTGSGIQTEEYYHTCK
jgi:hypothetical protein